jgi:hypothetical protein
MFDLATMRSLVDEVIDDCAHLRNRGPAVMARGCLLPRMARTFLSRGATSENDPVSDNASKFQSPTRATISCRAVCRDVTLSSKAANCPRVIGCACDTGSQAFGHNQ